MAKRTPNLNKIIQGLRKAIGGNIASTYTFRVNGDGTTTIIREQARTVAFLRPTPKPRKK
jgi:hypothetical protein